MTRNNQRKKPRSTSSRFGLAVLQTGLAAALVGVIALLVGVAISYAGLPDFSTLKRSPNGQSIEVRGADGTVLVSLGPSYGEWLPSERIPDSMKSAIIAVEDRRFRWHPGFDPIGTTRSLMVNVRAGRKVQGGSTLTQQLARNLFLTSSKTWARKGREIILALALERKFNKDAILELYLNRAYFGGGAYGIDAASRKFFGHPASRLSTAEAAIIAGLVQAPSRYSPSANADAARSRARTVLAAMVSNGAVSAAEAAAADPLSVPFTSQSREASVRYFTDWVIAELDNYIDEPFAPLQVRTTLDAGMQAAAEAAIAAETPAGAQGALMAVGNDGAIKAMVGGRDYVKSNYNRAVTAERQPGSAFKLFVYAAAFESGLTPDDEVEDKPLTIGNWSPRNFNRRYLGPMTVREAFARSTNTIAVDLASRVGFDTVADTARRFGISTPMSRMPAMALGTSEVTLFDMTQAYATVASGGTEHRAFAITRVTTSDGAVLYEREGGQSRVVVAPVVAARLTDVLIATVESGTGRAAKIDRPVAGKTGTTSSSKDGWFLGFTPSLTTGVWMGRDDAKAVSSLGGGTAPARAFARFMAKALANTPAEPLAVPIDPDAYPELEPDSEMYGITESGYFEELQTEPGGPLVPRAAPMAEPAPPYPDEAAPTGERRDENRDSRGPGRADDPYPNADMPRLDSDWLSNTLRRQQ